MAKPVKYVFITGGVMSGLGKGIAAASVGNLIKACGLKVNIQKCDPYLNVDAGLLNPREHGECFVTSDGAETDLDLGHYERFIDEELTQKSSTMQGRVLREVIEAERTGKYAGQTVQIIPHVTSAIQDHIAEAGKGFDVHIVEIGGTVGDYESMVFVEAIREFATTVGLDNCAFVHVVYLPYMETSHEVKTKPAQNSVRELRGYGIMPNILIARSERPVAEAAKRKLSMFSGVPEVAIALLPNASSVYEVPLTLESTGIADVILRTLGLHAHQPDMTAWRQLVAKATKTYDRQVDIGIVAKYLDNADTYLCVFEALKAAAWGNDVGVNIHWIDADHLAELDTEKFAAELQAYHGLIVPGGWGSRGVEGKVRAAQYALDTKLPYLGLCYGLQMGVIAAARRYGLQGANSTEVNPDAGDPVINLMEGQAGKESTGGTLRLGNYNCELEPDSLAARLYGTTSIVERHRHRWECNPHYVDQYEAWGIKAVGRNPGTGLIEVIEGIDHPYFIASQFHPEFKSRPTRPHPLFDGLIKAAKRLQKPAK